MTSSQLTPQVAQFLGQWPELAAWYGRGARALPWRAAPVDPYFIWISEVMSQQSTMKTVVPYFLRWVEKFPSIDALAQAAPDEVLRAWAGLGYYSRARNVHATSKALVEWRLTHSGKWPALAEEWLLFKGVGPYTAAAVASMAFGDPRTPVDGNVLRVGSRFFGHPDPLNTSFDRKSIEDTLNEAIRQVSAAEVPVFAQALMELGALVCRPGAQALCEICPLAPACVARLEGRVPEWPLSKRRPVIQEQTLLATLYWDGAEQMLFRQIPSGERLEGQWELPMRPASSLEIAEIAIKSRLLGPVTHSITRYRYKVWGLAVSPLPAAPPEGLRRDSWRSPELHLTTLTHKLLLKLDSLLI